MFEEVVWKSAAIMGVVYGVGRPLVLLGKARKANHS